jgi:hypothetical protein
MAKPMRRKSGCFFIISKQHITKFWVRNIDDFLKHLQRMPEWRIKFGHLTIFTSQPQICNVRLKVLFEIQQFQR